MAGVKPDPEVKYGTGKSMDSIESSSFTEPVYGSIKEGIIVLDFDGKVLYWNRAAERITGIRADKIIGKYIHHELPLRQAGLDVAELTNKLKASGHEEGIITWKTPEKVRSYKLKYTTRLTKNDKGKIIGATLSILDITRQSLQASALAAFREIARHASESTDLNSLLNFALAEISILVEADCGALHLYEEDSQTAELVGMYRLPEDLTRALARIHVQDVAPLTQAFLTGVPYAFHDINELSSPNRQLVSMGVKSGVVVPLKVAGQDKPARTLGAVTVLSTAPGAFDSESMEFLETISPQLALSIENLRISLERQRALDEQSRISKTLETMMENSSEGIVWLKDGKIIKANPAFARAVGKKSPRKLEGREFIEFFKPECRESLEETLREYRKGGDLPDRQILEVVARSKPVSLEASFSAVSLEEGDRLIQISAHDVTERLEFERMIQASEKRYRMMIELAQQGIISIDSSGEIVLANQRAAEIVGYETDEMNGQNIIDFISADWVPVINQLFISGSQLAVEQEEVNFLRKEGGEAQCAINAGPVIDEEGELQGYTIFINDLTETRSLREQLYTAEKMAAVGRLAGGIAHEFNNIHAAIQGTAELVLQQPNLAAEDREDLVSIRRLVRRASHITQQLLVFARKTPPHREMVNLNDLVEANLKIIKKEYSTEGISLVHACPGKAPELSLDPGRVGQLLMALIINARDAILEHGDEKLISIETGVEDDWAYVTVTDTGVGISLEAQSKIFEPFYTTKGALGGSTIPGTGLGLSVAHSIAREHGGEIKVASELGGGATFTVWLPMEVQEDTRLVTRPTALGPVVVGAKVLVVDDEKEVAGMMERALARAGYDVEVALLGRQAISKMYNNNYDIVLVDLQMPDVPGEKVLEEIKRLPEESRPVPIIITGRAGVGSVDEFADLDVGAVVNKPFYMATLFKAIHEGWSRLKNGG
jgi:PAS domain S-box-containing protein